MRIAILEDNSAMRHMLQLYLANALQTNVSYETHIFKTTRDFLDFFPLSNIDILITDYRLKSEQEKSGMSGADVIRAVRKDRPDLPVILISAAPVFELEDACRDIPDVHIMQKPFPVKQLLETIQALNK